MLTLLLLILSPVILFIFRVMYLIINVLTSDCKLEKPHQHLKTLLCIGSGGHTTELLRLLKSMNLKMYQPRLYVAAESDVSSEVKIHTLEKDGAKEYKFCKIPRSRSVNQSYVSSIFSTLHATLSTIPIVYNFKPDVIFCNGPGTCIPICIVAFLLRCVFVLDCRIVFVESICRVRTLSLTGKILQCFADIIIVQWPQLKDVCYRGKYFGRLT